MEKIKKFYPLIVGLVLLISVAAYGTRAYFSDSTTQEAGIELRLGNVDIKGDSSGWTYNSKGSNDNQLKDKDGTLVSGTKFNGIETFTNVKPGDSFTKSFTFTNKSTLNSTFSFNENITNDNSGFPYNVEFVVKSAKNYDGKVYENIPYQTIESLQNNHTLKGGESVIVAMTLTVDGVNIDNQYNSASNKFTKNNVLNLMSNNITVKLDQAK